MKHTPETPFRFPLGKVVATPGALLTLFQVNMHPGDLIRRHVRGDWGEMAQEDLEANSQALQDGSRIFSAYQVREDLRIWVITEADRSITTILLPEEY